MLAMIIVDQKVWGFSVLKGFEVSFSWLAWLFKKQIRTLAHHIAGRAAFRVCLLRFCFQCALSLKPSSLHMHFQLNLQLLKRLGGWSARAWRVFEESKGLAISLKSHRVWRVLEESKVLKNLWSLLEVGECRGVAFSKSAVKLGESLKLEVIKTLQCKAWSF